MDGYKFVLRRMHDVICGELGFIMTSMSGL